MSNVDLTKQLLKRVAAQVDKEVATVLKKEFRHASKISPLISELHTITNPMIIDGGKRLRGAFVYLSYLMHNGKSLEEAMKVTPFIELVHAYLLIHDDIMDKANLRRGFSTIHCEYEEVFKKKSKSPIGARHFGTSMGINVGDILCHLGLLTLTKSKFDDSAKIKALTKAHRNFTDVGYGQVLDVYGAIEDVQEEYVLQVHLYKTGYYTYETPLHVGAILAGANDDDLEVLTDYALPGGIAFQIVDDIIDLYGTFEQTGKLPGTDIKEGKKTLLTVKAYELATPKQRSILKDALGNPKVTLEQIEDVRKIIMDTGSLEYSQKKAKQLLNKSSKALNHAKKGLNKEGLGFLQGINEYMFQRMYDDENNRRSK